MTAITQTRVNLGLALAPASRGAVLDVSRRAIPWRWGGVLLAPLELLAVAWSVPVVMLLVMVPIGLALSGLLWVGRFILSVL
jgi:hypothetical protein